MIIEFAEFMRKNYSYIIVATLIISIIIGFYTSYLGELLKIFSIPLTILMIASMGFTIKFKNFLLALKDIRGFSIGIILNFIFSPILCYVVSLLIPNPKIATGIILIGAIPCAGMAIVWTGLLEGDVPLATVINTGTMIVAPFLIPVIMFYFAGSYVKINIIDMFLNLICTILIPIFIGIGLREVLEKKADVKHYLPLCPAISSLCAILLMFIAVNTSMPLLMKNVSVLPSLLISIAITFPSMFSVAYLTSKKFPYKKTIAITYSSGMKNLPIGLGIAILSFGMLTASVIAIGFAFQMLTAVGFYRVFQRNLRNISNLTSFSKQEGKT